MSDIYGRGRVEKYWFTVDSKPCCNICNILYGACDIPPYILPLNKTLCKYTVPIHYAHGASLIYYLRHVGVGMKHKTPTMSKMTNMPLSVSGFDQRICI
jgi:hypothetical protein